MKLDRAREVAERLGVARHVIVDFDLRQFGGSALTSDIEVPKERSAEDMSWHSHHLCARTEHDLPEFRLGLG